MIRVISDRQLHHMLSLSEVETPSDDCYIESNHIRNIMMLLGSVRNTNGTHGASNTARTASYIKSVRRLYLTPVRYSLSRMGDSILFKDENASQDGLYVNKACA